MKCKSKSSLEDARGPGVSVTQAGNPESPLLPPSPFATCPPVLLQPVIHVQDSDLQSRSRICLLPASAPTTPAITPPALDLCREDPSLAPLPLLLSCSFHPALPR